MKHSFILLILFTGIKLNAQKADFLLQFKPVFKQQELRLNDTFYLLNNGKDTVQITKLKFYISAIELYNDKQLIYTEKNSFHLIDASDTNSYSVCLKGLPNKAYNNIKFNLGIDSATNAKGAMGGALDPTKGMYWTWHSGYINFKLEGTSNLCNTRNNGFEFHLGGFSYPNNSLQRIQLDFSNMSAIVVNVDVARFLAGVGLDKTNMIMTSSKTAVELSKQAAGIFKTIK
jgi:hypothetical protein